MSDKEENDMVGIIHIYSLFNKKEFKEGTVEKRVAMLHAEYERCCEKSFIRIGEKDGIMHFR